MSKTKELSLAAVAGLGLAIMAIGLWLFHLNRITPTPDEASVALGALTRVPLWAVRSPGSATIEFDIPNTEQWQHIRKHWGERRVEAPLANPVENASEEW